MRKLAWWFCMFGMTLRRALYRPVFLLFLLIPSYRFLPPLYILPLQKSIHPINISESFSFWLAFITFLR